MKGLISYRSGLGAKEAIDEGRTHGGGGNSKPEIPERCQCTIQGGCTFELENKTNEHTWK